MLSLPSAKLETEAFEITRDNKMLEVNFTSNVNVMERAPCFRGTRIPFSEVAKLHYSGADIEIIYKQFPSLSRDEIEMACRIASACRQVSCGE